MKLRPVIPGYLGAQNTYHVGYIKGVGKIYRQTFINTYTRVAFAKVYDRKNALVAADMLNYKVFPFYREQDVELLGILTDRETEYCRAREHCDVVKLDSFSLNVSITNKSISYHITFTIHCC